MATEDLDWFSFVAVILKKWSSEEIDYVGPCEIVIIGLDWFGHVERKGGQQWVKKCMDFKMNGSVGRGRPRKSWLECVNDDMKKFGLKKEMAHDRTMWRSAIH